MDLLDIHDPHDLGGNLPGLARTRFNIPFDSVECVLVLDPSTIGVAIDTNFPGQDGRTRGLPDDTELIKLRFARALSTYAPGGGWHP